MTHPELCLLSDSGCCQLGIITPQVPITFLSDVLSSVNMAKCGRCYAPIPQMPGLVSRALWRHHSYFVIPGPAEPPRRQARALSIFSFQQHQQGLRDMSLIVFQVTEAPGQHHDWGAFFMPLSGSCHSFADLQGQVTGRVGKEHLLSSTGTRNRWQERQATSDATKMLKNQLGTILHLVPP